MSLTQLGKINGHAHFIRTVSVVKLNVVPNHSAASTTAVSLNTASHSGAHKTKYYATSRLFRWYYIRFIITTRLKSALRARPRCARMESHWGLTIGTPMVRTHTLDPTPDAPRSYNLTLPIQLLIKDSYGVTAISGKYQDVGCATFSGSNECHLRWAICGYVVHLLFSLQVYTKMVPSCWISIQGMFYSHLYCVVKQCYETT